MSTADLAAFGSLISSFWRLFSGFELPIIHVTAAELFIAFAFVSLVVKFLKGLTQINNDSGDNK